MFNLSNVTIKRKLVLIAALSFAVLLIDAGISLYKHRETMLEDRYTKTRHVVETAFSTIEYFHKLHTAGLISEFEEKTSFNPRSEFSW